MFEERRIRRKDGAKKMDRAGIALATGEGRVPTLGVGTAKGKEQCKTRRSILLLAIG
jgi:hypothetical protein